MALWGGCFCGDIRYEATGTTFHETICHCSICRRVSGAPMVAWFSVPHRDFRLVRGEPAQFRSTAKATRSFCPRCGTQLTFLHDDSADEIGITIASLDDPNALSPWDHSFAGTKLRWIELGDGLPTYRETRQRG